jgi:GntP family gluconate:H+ symporter
MHPLLVLVVSMAAVIGLIVWARLHAFLALLIGAVLVGVLSPAIATAESVTLAATELGAVTGRIGIIIALASFIGLGLQHSGGAARIGAFFLSLTGAKRGHYAMAANGYILSIPVFFDTVFYLMAPLIKAMHAQARWGYALFLMAVVGGAASTHVFVPPTPGPLAAASQLGVDLGLMILIGAVVAVVGTLGGLVYASWAFKQWPDLGAQVRAEIERASAEEQGTQTSHQPSLALSFMPIVLPIILIAGRTIVAALGLTGPLAVTATFLGDPNVALFLALLVTMYLLVSTRGMSRIDMARLTEEAFASAGTIILITAAGGAYGGMLTRAQIGATLADYAAAMGLPVLVLAFLLASLLKIAQGSSTVAIITSASVIAGIYAGGDATVLPHPVYAALAAAGGSLVISWMNDSGFWVIAKMGGLTNSETLRMWTGTAATVGTTGFLTVVLLSWILPLK